MEKLTVNLIAKLFAIIGLMSFLFALGYLFWQVSWIAGVLYVSITTTIGSLIIADEYKID